MEEMDLDWLAQDIPVWQPRSPIGSLHIRVDPDGRRQVNRPVCHQTTPLPCSLDRPSAIALVEPVPRDPTTQPRWLTTLSERRIRAALGEDANSPQCLACHYVYTSRKRLRVHVRQRWAQVLCTCGEVSIWRETITKHQTRNRRSGGLCKKGLVYEVDAESLYQWREATGVPAEHFPPCRPLHWVLTPLPLHFP